MSIKLFIFKLIFISAVVLVIVSLLIDTAVDINTINQQGLENRDIRNYELRLAEIEAEFELTKLKIAFGGTE